MGQFIKVHQPCPCGESSDAYAVAKDHGFCFSCNKLIPFGDVVLEKENETFTYEFLSRRGITKETHEFFGVKTQIGRDGKPVSVVYNNPKGYRQYRFLDEKDFRYSGTVKPGGFCLDKFPAGSARAITITEGFDDAMSAWQMLGNYPVYSVKSASSALSDVRADYDYLNSFEKIYLALDSDKPGEEATKQVAAVFGYGKVYVLKLAPLKDPTEFLEQKREKEFRNLWHNAKRYMPEAVVSSFEDIWNAIQQSKTKVRFEWPWASWQRMTGGIEIHRQYILSGLEGTGKTEELHQIIDHLLEKYPDMNIGCLLIEQILEETIKMQVGKRLKKPIHLPEFELSNEELMAQYKDLVKREDRLHFFKHFGSEETDAILSTIRFMVAACGCEVVVFDNYQHAVTGRTKDRDTEALDYLANRLEALVKELPFALLCISHENANEETRGSKNITKEADVWINIKRNVKDENEFTRNIQAITFNKNRQAGKTGPAGKLIYDQATATLSELSGELPS